MQDSLTIVLLIKRLRLRPNLSKLVSRDKVKNL